LRKALAEKRRDDGIIRLTSCRCHRHRVELLRRRLRQATVHINEKERTSKARALVAIAKSPAPRDTNDIRSREIGQVGFWIRD
jgi:hypothetical protein